MGVLVWRWNSWVPQGSSGTVGGRISGRNHRHQVTSIQKMEAMRAVDGTRDSKSGFGRFLFLGG